MDLILSIMIVVVILIFAAFFAWVVYEIIENKTNNKYKKLPFHAYYTGNAKNMKDCPENCTRGRCNSQDYCKDHYPPNPKCCAFDFQCNYCKDKETGMYYLEPGYDQHIVNRYNKRMSKDATDILNEEIEDNNTYIDNINNNIKQINSENGY